MAEARRRRRRQRAVPQSSKLPLRYYPQLFLRCYGEQDQARFYDVYEKIEGSPHCRVRYNVRVCHNEEKVEIFRSRTNTLVMQSFGGIFESSHQMNVMDPSNTVVGKIDNDTVETTSNVPIDLLIDWDFVVTMPEAPQLRPLSLRDPAGYEKCQIYGHEHMGCTVMRIVNTRFINSSEMAKTFVILAATKRFYDTYKYHQQPVPVGILNMMGMARAPPADMSVLQNMSRVKIRAAARNYNGEIFLDVLDASDHKIIAVVTAANGYVIVRDTFREAQVTMTKLFVGNNNVFHLIDSNSRQFGTMNPSGSKMEDIYEMNSRLSEYQGDAHPQYERKTRKISYHKVSSDVRPAGDYGCVAEYGHEKGMATILLNMDEWLDVRKKAMILIRAVKIAYEQFRTWDDIILPTMNDYLYRPKL